MAAVTRPPSRTKRLTLRVSPSRFCMPQAPSWQASWKATIQRLASAGGLQRIRLYSWQTCRRLTLKPNPFMNCRKARRIAIQVQAEATFASVPSERSLVHDSRTRGTIQKWPTDSLSNFPWRLRHKSAFEKQGKSLHASDRKSVLRNLHSYPKLRDWVVGK